MTLGIAHFLGPQNPAALLVSLNTLVDDINSLAGGGSVTSVSVVTANGVSGSVANPTTTPAITLTLGAITPSSVAASGTVTGSNLSGTNTGDVTLSGETYITNVGQALTLAKITEAQQLLAANTTNNVSTARHGYQPVLPNDATKFMDGTGNYTVPPGTGLSPALTSAHLFVGNGSNVATDTAMSGDITINNAGVTTIGAVITTAKFAANVADTDVTLAANSDTRFATQKATKSYVDAVASGLSVKTSCLLATTAALPTLVYANGASGVGATLTGVSVGALTIDGTATAVNDRVLVKDQVAALQNGIYNVTATGSGIAVFVLTRATDFDTSAEIVGGAFTFIEEGTANTGAGFVLTTVGTVTVGTTAINWTQFSGAGEITAGTGLTKSGNTLSLTNPVTVALGGTGAATFTAHGVMLGEGTSALVPTAAGTNGQMLLGQTSADPTWNAMSGDATLAANGALTIAANAITTSKINNSAVTYAKIQNEAAITLLGNPTGGAAAPSEVTLGQGLAFSGTALASSMTLLAQYDYTANNTWTPNANTKVIFVQVCGGGASGGSGSSGTTAAARGGGTGGSAGEVQEQWFLIGDIGAGSQAITVGAQQTTVGTGVTGTTAGNVGTNGNLSSFGSLLVARGGVADPTGLQDTFGGFQQYRPGGNAHPGFASAAGGSANSAAGIKGGRPALNAGPGAGAVGGGLTITTAVTIAGLLGGAGHNANGKGLYQNTTILIGEGGGTVGPKDSATAAIAAADIGANLPWFGDGGPSGGSSKTTNGGAGANGAAPGAGGGGGGACDNTHTSGAGGRGARGSVRIWEFG